VNPARIFLVEDEHLTRVGTRAILEKEFEIVGEADNVTDAVEMIRDRKPDLVLLDIRIREGSGAEVLRQVRKTDPEILFLAVTVSTSRRDVAELFREGVDGYLTKQAIGPDLPELVHQALGGERPISRQVAGFLLDIDEDITDDSGIARLTLREREVVVLIARGFTYRETAAELDMAVKTLENHIHSIFRKLGVASRHELSAVAYGTGFVDPQS
jgi:DNA-binding NarL/FixJ family response regulator